MSSSFITIRAPDILCLYMPESAEATLAFLNSLYQPVPHSIRLDFSDTRRITASAALVLLAHVHYLQYDKQNFGYFQFDCKKSPLYRSVFIKDKYLTCLKKGAKVFLEAVPYRCKKSSEYFGKERKQSIDDIERLRQKLLENQTDTVYISKVNAFFKDLRTVVSEMLLNIREHAYISPPNEKAGFDIFREQLWWQAFWYFEREQEIVFIIYDLGLGIVRSYLEHATRTRDTHYQFITKSEVFEEALEAGRSRFIGDGRGNGLANVVDIAIQNPSVSLQIFTDNLSYNIRQQHKQFRELKNGLRGTLFQWSFKLPKKGITND